MNGERRKKRRDRERNVFFTPSLIRIYKLLSWEEVCLDGVTCQKGKGLGVGEGQGVFCFRERTRTPAGPSRNPRGRAMTGVQHKSKADQ